MVTVFIWRPTRTAYGHAAMRVTGGKPSGNIYISWWPSDAVSGVDCSPADPNTSLAQDIAAENNRRPDFAIDITGLNETAIKRWWARYARRATQWCTLWPNCSTVVARALEAGGGDLYATTWDSHSFGVWTPLAVKDYAMSIRRELLIQRRGRGCRVPAA